MACVDEVTARQRAQEVLDNESSPQELVDLAEFVLATTNEPTMADVKWDAKEHFLAGADWSGHSPVVMVKSDYDSTITAIGDDGARLRTPFKADLTPNGKRYKLVEITDEGEYEQPKVLVTKQDYENAPEGTIIVTEGHTSTREAFGWYIAGCEGGRSSEYMARLGEGEVVRWGE